LAALWRSGATDRQLFAAYPALTDRHLQEARRYIHEHEEEIERDLREQESND